MLLRRGQCITEGRPVRYWGKDNVFFRGGQCGTEERTVHN